MFLIIIAFILHIYATYTVHARIKHNGGRFRKPLNDVIHNNTPNFSSHAYVIDPITLIFIIPLITKCNINIIKHFLNILAIIIILRSIALLTTDIPRSDITCNPYSIGIYNIFFGHCYDKIFSGHTAFTLLCVLVSYKYKLTNTSILILLSFLQIIHALSLIVTRGHYTIDVLLSYYIVIPLYFCIVDFF